MPLHPRMPGRRARCIATAMLTLLLLVVAGCGGSSANDPAPAGPANAQGTFPTKVDTKFGPVEITQQPHRVVALGWGDAETALALGVQPVGASDWLAFGGEGVGPWAAGRYDNPPEIISTMEPSYEQIAALQPDLILDVKGSGEQQRHDQLAQIAPTVGVPAGADNYLTSSSDQVRLISAALGLPDKGEELLAEVDARFTQVAAAHPQWKDRTVTAATRTSEGWGAYIESSERVQFLKRLGFAQNPTIAGMQPNSGGFSVTISAEQLNLLEADVILAMPIYVPEGEITQNPSWQAIPAVKDGRAIILDQDDRAAWSLGSTLATQYALDKLVPQLEQHLP